MVAQGWVEGPGAEPTGWRPFQKDSPFNLPLPTSRTEEPISTQALSVAPMAVSDAEFGIKLFFNTPSDPEWTIAFTDYNSYDDNWNPMHPLRLRAPLGLSSPDGSDGTVILVDEQKSVAYEMWQLNVKQRGANPTASASSVNVVDLRSNGVHRNVGITGSGLPGVGGLLRRSDMQARAAGTPIQHKLWIAVHPDLLFARAVWPASRYDVTRDGRLALLNYGDVIALSRKYDIANGECGLSPSLQHLAQALQDYGGIVQDRGGDSVGILGEVGAVTPDPDSTADAYWAQLVCLKKYVVRIPKPWDGL